MGTIDLEKGYGSVPPVADLPSLATFIASDPDGSIFMCRRFDRLSARNLLQLQNELMELEVQQDNNDAEIRRLGLESKRSLRSWNVPKGRATQPNNVLEAKALSLAKEIEEKLKEYS